MRPSNPACYECPKGKSRLHTWKRLPDLTAVCVECKQVLNKNDAAECFYDRET
jgi:hypothetical protein